MNVVSSSPVRNAAAPVLQPSPQASLDHIKQLLPQLTAGVARHRDGITHERLDKEAFIDVTRLGATITDELHNLSIGRWENKAERRELARGLAGQYATAIADLPGVWAVPGDAMKPLVNVRRGAERITSVLAKPDLDLSSSVDGWGLNQSANGLRQVAYGLATLTAPIAGPGFRFVGLARAANDAILRINDGIRSGGENMPFRAGKQADTAVALLSRVLAEGADVVSQPAASALAGAIAASAGQFDRDGHAFPAGPDAYVAAMTSLKSAAAAVLTNLDGAATPYLNQPGAAGDTYRAWRTVQTVHGNTPYWDSDIGS